MFCLDQLKRSFIFSISLKFLIKRFQLRIVMFYMSLLLLNMVRCENSNYVDYLFGN